MRNEENQIDALNLILLNRNSKLQIWRQFQFTNCINIIHFNWWL